MHFQKLHLLAVFGMSLTMVPVGAGLVLRQIPSKPCSQYTGGVHVIVTPGEGYASPPFGFLTSTAAAILKALPGSSNVSLPYDHSDKNGTRQTHAGAATLRQYIQQYQQSCPYTRIVLLGYSSGAVITMNTLCGETNPPFPSNIPPLSISTYAGNLIAAIAYGDETRTAGADYNYGTCTANGKHPRNAYAQGNCEKWSQILRSYCQESDPQCCTTGTNPDAHFVYASKYDKEVASYVVSQFHKFGS